MAVIYEETQDIIPKESFKMLLIISIATIVFATACAVADLVEFWALGIIAIVFALVLLVTYYVKVTIKIEDGYITVNMLKEYKVPLDYVIDVKKGDIDIMRNYSGWGIKKVKFKNYVVPGIDNAVSAKLMGRIVLTMTSNNPDKLYDILHENRRKD